MKVCFLRSCFFFMFFLMNLVFGFLKKLVILETFVVQSLVSVILARFGKVLDILKWALLFPPFLFP